MNRKLRNNIYFWRTIISFSLGATILIAIISLLIFKGLDNISFDFIFSESRNFGAQGGIIYQILGSLLMVVTAGILGFPIAFGLALFIHKYIVKSSTKKIFRSALFILNGVPSIIFGLFGLLLFVNILGTGISWFVGSIILAFMILPTISISTLQSLEGIPQIFIENGYALGFNRWEVISRVLPQSIQGGITGLFLGLARIIGETAPIMFIATAFSGVEFPSSLFEPVSSLPTHILALAQQANNPNALNNAWAAGLVLLICVLLISIASVPLRLKQKRL